MHAVPYHFITLSQKCHLLDWYELAWFPPPPKKKYRHSTHKWVLSNLYYTQAGRQIQTAPPQSFLKWLARLVVAHARTCSLTQGPRHLSDTVSLLCSQKVLSRGTHRHTFSTELAGLCSAGCKVKTGRYSGRFMLILRLDLALQPRRLCLWSLIM